MIAVLDASIAVKWFAPDGDADDGVAEAVLRRVADQPRGFVVPELFFYELTSVLCRRLRQARDVVRATERVSRLGLRRLRLDEQLVRRAARLAFERRITGYDASYAAVAFELGGKWLTFDRAAHARVEALGICENPDGLKRLDGFAAQTTSNCKNSIMNVPRPCVSERRSVE